MRSHERERIFHHIPKAAATNIAARPGSFGRLANEPEGRGWLDDRALRKLAQPQVAQKLPLDQGEHGRAPGAAFGAPAITSTRATSARFLDSSVNGDILRHQSRGHPGGPLNAVVDGDVARRHVRRGPWGRTARAMPGHRTGRAVPKVRLCGRRGISDAWKSRGAVSTAHFRHADGSMFGLMNTLQLQLLMLIFAGWVNRGQQDVIESLQQENRVLRGHLGGRRLPFTNRQRRRLASSVKAIAAGGAP
jgi:hypothetical protein